MAEQETFCWSPARKGSSAQDGCRGSRQGLAGAQQPYYGTTARATPSVILLLARLNVLLLE